MLMISKDKTKFSLLSKNSFQMCNSYHFQFCNHEIEFYQTNVSKFFVIALFMQNTRDIKTLCKQMIVLNEKLPTTRYLSYGTWIIVTKKPLTFTSNCQLYESDQGDVKFIPPFGVIQLNNTCVASKDYLQLPEYFGENESFSKVGPFACTVKTA